MTETLLEIPPRPLRDAHPRPEPGLREIESDLILRDGASLHYRAWLPAAPAAKALLLFHRGHEHSGRWRETVEALGLRDVAIFAWDCRGHGHSTGERGAAPGVETIVGDMDEFARHIESTYSIAPENTIALAHSVGAVLLAAWVHDYAPRLRAMILAAPAFRVKLYLPLALPALRLKEKLFGHGFVSSYVRPSMLTHAPDQARAYAADPLIFKQIAVNVLLGLHDTSTRLLADAGAIAVPTLILAAGRDWVVKNGPQRRFFDAIRPRIKRFKDLPDFHHSIFHEKDSHIAIDAIREFIRERFETPLPEPNWIQADKQGHTKEEYDRLRGIAPGPVDAVVKTVLKSAGSIAKGIRIGWRHGFDSGVSLDHVYANRAEGSGPLGRLVDRIYLDSVGWQGIRVRGATMQRTLEAAIRAALAEHGEARILDIASGPGRYVLETVARIQIGTAAGAISARNAADAIHVTLRDYQEANLEGARAHAERLGLNNVVIAQGDAFDADSLAAIAPRPNIAIVSGLYELIPENDPIRRSLAGLARALAPGATLLYTNQPWHPQIEFIARTLRNREGQPWIMRRRTQAEMDALVREAGFCKTSQEIDRWGIFSVSTARRVSG